MCVKLLEDQTFDLNSFVTWCLFSLDVFLHSSELQGAGAGEYKGWGGGVAVTF